MFWSEPLSELVIDNDGVVEGFVMVNDTPSRVPADTEVTVPVPAEGRVANLPCPVIY